MNTRTPARTSRTSSRRSPSARRSRPAVNILTPKNLMLGLLMIVFAVLATYKIYEWQTMRSLISAHNSLLTTELDKIEENSQRYLKFQEENEQDDDESSSPDFSDMDAKEITESFSKTQSNAQLLIDAHKDYIKLLEDHQAQVRQLKSQASWLKGERKDFVLEMLDTLDAYYTNELADSGRGLVESHLSLAILQTNKDQALIQNFMNKTDGFSDRPAIKEHFSDLASLEKYSRKDFEFDMGEEIQEANPYGYESLITIRDFFSSFYSAVKSAAADDYASAYYKFSRLEKDILALQGVDFDRIRYENEDEAKATKRNMVESLNKRLELYQKFEEQNLGVYPLLETAGGWNVPASVCHLYLYKLDMYKTHQRELPGSGDLNAFLNDLGELSPETKLADEMYAQQLLAVDNNDEKLKFECKNTQGDVEYSFSYIKED